MALLDLLQTAARPCLGKLDISTIPSRKQGDASIAELLLSGMLETPLSCLSLPHDEWPDGVIGDFITDTISLSSIENMISPLSHRHTYPDVSSTSCQTSGMAITCHVDEICRQRYGSLASNEDSSCEGGPDSFTSLSASETSGTLKIADAHEMVNAVHQHLQPSRLWSNDYRKDSEFSSESSCKARVDDETSNQHIELLSCGEFQIHTTEETTRSILLGEADGNRSSGDRCLLDSFSPAGTSASRRGTAARRRKRRRGTFKNSTEIESQRLMHITVERNRRKLMNEHLSALRSLLPQSYIQKGDQASIIGGAIQFVKELEYVLQALQTEKSRAKAYPMNCPYSKAEAVHPQQPANKLEHSDNLQLEVDRSLLWAIKREDTHIESKGIKVDIILLESSVVVKVLAQKLPNQLFKLTSSIESLHMKIVELSITTVGDNLLYSFNLQVEGGSQSYSVDAIAHMILNVDKESKTII
ncbi:hypothetical protein KP509_26G015300 [Ceratopteris richardii]|uniref:BHLH domain-containing protein n=1 Tax=Ceratopteris richardii TaxID=49495 RepID=A0A8T2RL15_CERRI|nr:hypothetical protein KP509_26G015300 [Ceratopteris richardii]KAH7296245.1 hypothetical protein KP509_26G015300 [Ceratopteris richardii]